MQIIQHIIGTNKPLRLRLKNAGGFLDLSVCTIEFRGKSDSRSITEPFYTAPGAPNAISFSILDIVDETKDKYVKGRFWLDFPTGEKYSSIELYIAVKK